MLFGEIGRRYKLFRRPVKRLQARASRRAADMRGAEFDRLTGRCAGVWTPGDAQWQWAARSLVGANRGRQAVVAGSQQIGCRKSPLAAVRPLWAL